MVVTLTPNPAVDQSIEVSRIEPGATHRHAETRLDPAGKGINVSRMVHRLGGTTIALGFVAGEIGELVEGALDHEGVQHHFIRVPGQTRINVAIRESATGNVTLFNGPGPVVDAESLANLGELLKFASAPERVVVLAGSLPRSIPADYFHSAIGTVAALGARTILDTHGEALKRAVAARPNLIKPNVSEAEALLGRRLPGRRAVVGAARELTARGIDAVVISMGADGAICAQGNRCWHARAPRVEARSTVGSGDSMVAGLAIALELGSGIVEGLRLGTAAGAATAATPGTALASMEDVDTLLPGVRIEEIG